jgi:hypothetical protein
VTFWKPSKLHFVADKTSPSSNVGAHGPEVMEEAVSKSSLEALADDVVPVLSPWEAAEAAAAAAAASRAARAASRKQANQGRNFTPPKLLKRMSAHWEIKCVTSTFFTILTFLPQGC